MELHRDIYILSKCIEAFLENMNTPGNCPTFMFEIYMINSRAKSFLLKVRYPEPFPVLYEGFDITKMITNLYNGYGRFGNDEITYYNCEELLEFAPECSGPFTKRPKTNSYDCSDVELCRRRKVCQYYINNYYRRCNEISASYIKVATIVCSDKSNIFMNPLIWFGNGDDILGF